MAKELVKKSSSELEEFEAYSGGSSAGEDMSREDMAIPRLSILQSNSPQTQKRETTYVKGAEPGMIYDMVNDRVWDGEEGIVIVPVHYRRTYIEWILRENGGGFVLDHGMAGVELVTKRDDNNREILPNGNQLVQTMEYIVFALTGEGYTPSVISLTSSQLRHGRKFNTQLNTATLIHPATGEQAPAPIYYRSWGMTTFPESNDKGSWFSWRIVSGGKLSELNYPWLKNWVEFSQACEAFRKAVKSEQVQLKPPVQEVDTSEDVPF